MRPFISLLKTDCPMRDCILETDHAIFSLLVDMVPLESQNKIKKNRYCL